MSQSQKARIGFERRGIDLAVDAILPIRQVKPSDQCFGKYRAVLASIKAIGLVEPIVVYPNKGAKGTFLLLDGQRGRPSHSVYLERTETRRERAPPCESVNRNYQPNSGIQSRVIAQP